MMDLVGLSRPVDAGTTRFFRPLAVRYHGGDSKLYRSRSSFGATLTGKGEAVLELLDRQYRLPRQR